MNNIEKFLTAAMADMPEQADRIRIQRYLEMGHLDLACAPLREMGKDLGEYLLKWSREAELTEDEATDIAMEIANQCHCGSKLVGDRIFIWTTNEWGGDEEFFELYVASDTTAIELAVTTKSELVAQLASLGDDARLQVENGRLFAVVPK